MPKKTRRPAKPPSTETPWMNHLLVAFSEVPGVLVWRQNSGKLIVRHARGVYAIKLAPEGASDITGVGPGGVHIEVECKLAKGKKRKAQIRWGDRMMRLGAVHFEAWYNNALTVEANVAAQVAKLRAELAKKA